MFNPFKKAPIEPPKPPTPVRVPFDAPAIHCNAFVHATGMFDDLAHILGHVSEGLERGSLSTSSRDHITEATDNLLTALLAIRAAAGCTTTRGH